MNRKNLFEFIFYIIFSVLINVAYNGFLYERILPNSFFMFAYDLFRTILTIIVIRFAWQIFSELDISNKGESEEKDNILSWNRSSIIKGFLVLIVLWMPYYVLFWPGTASWDTIFQIEDFFNGTTWVESNNLNKYVFLSNHHPIFDTLVYSSVIAIGNAIGHNNIVFGLFTFIQMLLFSIELSSITCFMQTFGIKLSVRKSVYFFFGLVPFVPIYAILSVKDTLYALCFIPFLIIFISICRGDKDNKKYRFFLILCLFMALTKNTGALVASISALFIPAKEKKLKYKIASVLLPIILTFFVLPRIIFPTFNVLNGYGAREYLQITFQQTAYLLKTNNSFYTEGEKKKINRVMSLDGIEEDFDFYITDPVKSHYNCQCSRKDLLDYLKIWFMKGFKHPSMYLTALMGTMGGYVAPVKQIEIYTKISYYSEYSKISNFAPQLCERFEKLYSDLTNIPFISFIFCLSTYSMIIPSLCITLTCRNKDKERIILYIPFVLTIVTVLISPYSFSRYVLPLFLSWPLMISIAKADQIDKFLKK